jgi:DNA (cytosine-5)-methyltransferase 1
VFSCEWDKYARKTYSDNFGDEPVGDIRQVNGDQVPDHDILVAGFPCQPFSLSGIGAKRKLGQQTGFSDQTQGTLFFDVLRIIKAKRPRAFLLENVKNLVSHDKGNTFRVIEGSLREIGYNVHFRIMDSKGLVPQHRERIFIVGFDKPTNFSFPEIADSRPKLSSLLEGDVPEKYTLSDNLWKWLQSHAEKHAKKGHGFGYSVANLDGIARTLSARYYKDGSEILIPQAGRNPRKLTPRECARLMGFEDSYKMSVSCTRSYKQFGNSVVVPLVREIAKQVVLSLTTGGQDLEWPQSPS